MSNDYGVLCLIMQLIGELCIGESSRSGGDTRILGHTLTLGGSEDQGHAIPVPC